MSNSRPIQAPPTASTPGLQGHLTIRRNGVLRYELWRRVGGSMLNRFALFLAGLVAVTSAAAAAKPVVLHCRGYQVSDKHKLTDQIITLDQEKNIVVSIELLGHGAKDVINAPISATKREFRWIYNAVQFKYVLEKSTMSLQLLSIPGELLGKFDCETKDKLL